MPLQKLTEFLDEKEKKYIVMKHSQAYTAQEVAASAHIPGDRMIKTVMIKADGDMKMVVLDANHDVDFDQIADQIGADKVSLASEDDFKDLFPGCEVGAMPPFGNLYDMDTYVAESLSNKDEIAFNAGTHKELIKMSYRDFNELVQPNMIPAGVRHI